VGPITGVAGTTGTEGIAETADGGFLVADTGSHVVRKVEPIG
jgi:hypothetical protein